MDSSVFSNLLFAKIRPTLLSRALRCSLFWNCLMCSSRRLGEVPRTFVGPAEVSRWYVCDETACRFEAPDIRSPASTERLSRLERSKMHGRRLFREPPLLRYSEQVLRSQRNVSSNGANCLPTRSRRCSAAGLRPVNTRRRRISRRSSSRSRFESPSYQFFVHFLNGTQACKRSNLGGY